MQKNTYTLTNLPKDAKEYRFSLRLLKNIDAEGYCVHRANIPDFIRWIKTIVKNKKLSKEVSDFETWANKLSKKINYICIFPSTSLSEIKIASLRNHERFHAQTLRYNHDWYEMADCVLTDQFEKLWINIAKQIVELDCHEELVNERGYSWVAVAETLARVCAILHAAPKYRRQSASCQLYKYKSLLKFAKNFEQIYGDVESFIKIINRNLNQ